ncbi:cobalamin Fe3+-siderophores ABC transporter permease [Staphylococcus gallinarum]|uniref:Cobalamin Fe3+-siderophores ABC transporter permease n=1 Tax=Staphylococcus gallinarum TaxID=1293 RepID=A0A380FL70_STAGA|nr:cobalamin Fe3+-siderophores ABC transporter permease [Staphylococcus gallinarum]
MWLTGSLYGHNMSNVYVLLPWFILSLPVIFYFCHQLDILTLGDDIAIALGTKVKMIKMILLFLAVTLAGASISVVGGLSFLGLIAPHIARRMVGHKHIHITTMSGLIGALILVISDGFSKRHSSTNRYSGRCCSSNSGCTILFILIEKNISFQL